MTVRRKVLHQITTYTCILLLALILIIKIEPSITASTSNSNNIILSQYQLQNDSYFTHLVYDKRRSSLYAGATNRIIQFNKNLTIINSSVTGPKPDSPVCHAGGCPDDVETIETNNFNKLLILNTYGDALISCGSLHQGACEIYENLNNFPKSPRYIELPVVANDENSSSYAFIGPSRYTTWQREDILYVGTTFTNVGDYRDNVPAIASRKLDDLNYAEFSIQQSNINIDVKYRDHFLVNYIYGFNSTDFAYFMLVQKKNHLVEEAGYHTRLSRICVTDPNYDSYTEVTLSCLVKNQDYNILRDAKLTEAGTRLGQKLGIRKDDQVLVATFSPSKEITSETQNSSAICVYTLKDIEEMFNENIHMCFNGTTKDRNLGYISGSILDGKCPPVGTIGNIHDFCHAGLKISGVAAIVANAIFNFDSESVTSITTTLTGPHTVAFLGTTEGNIKKVLLSDPSAGEYDRVEVDPDNLILPDTMVSPEQDYLYVLSRKKITKMRIENCASHTTCSSCLESNDVFCGWCSLEKRCTVRGACQRDTSASRWLSIGVGQQCIDFETAIPDKVPINQMTTVNLVIKTLPELPSNAKYKCVFGNSTPIDAAVTENGLICQTPQLKYRPTIELGKDHILVPLSVRSSETNKDFVSRSFAFFDCSVHDSCFKCLKSQWNCNWCIYDNKCVFQNSTCRNTASMISAENQCPRIKPPKNEILLPNKVPKEIKLEIINLPRPQSAHSGFLCIVNIEGAHMILPARIEANKYIVCDKTPYSYEANTNEYKAKVDVTWNRNHYIDTISITLYKCDVLGSHKEHADCSLCVTRDQKYQCTWCNKQCVFNDTCMHGAASECPRPRIDSIKPLSGPIEGGTLVSIEGSNLGIREDDVRGKIRIGNVPCELVNYEISVKIECRTGPVDKEMTATVKVGNEAGITESNVYFQYKDFKIDRILPTQGPQSGGTQLQIFGRHLNIGSSVIAYLDDYICHINLTHATNDRLVCTTTASRSPEFIRTLTLIVDLANRTLQCKNGRGHNSNDIGMVASYNGVGNANGGSMRHGACSIYNYTVDPKIMQIKPLKSFKSGGRMITVHGTNLHTIQNPQMEVIFGDDSINRTDCTVINPNQMECPSPSVTEKFRTYFIAQKSKTKRNVISNIDAYPTATREMTPQPSSYMAPSAAFAIQETQLNFQISFIMDNVKTVRDLNKHFQHIRSNLIYVDDPVFFPFLNSIRLYKGDTLVIEGENLNLACDESDVIVTVGSLHCNVTSLALAQLVCTPPAQQPASTDENGNENDIDLPLVVVRVGQKLRFPLGYLKYDLLKPYAFSQAMIVIAASTFVLAIVLVFILIIYRRKTTQAEREYKKIQIQMDTLESNVRLECKQAFAELQTDILDLTADLENQGIPALDHVNYIMKVFFPGVSDHPILNGHKGRMNMLRTNYDAAMLQFEQLINNKFFLLTFIETLEAQRTFNIRDKVNVASLLMVVLMNKMEYATDILKLLLLRLVDKSVMTKHPHLMLRRTESVVEKMLTNYMAICMYNYLREYSGSSLFLLFKAIKHQVEKGLVDAITHEARYSLSEDRLLREQIDTNGVTLHILQDDLEEKVQCKVLDQDTITQVKSKILDSLFKNTPFSMRPSVHDVDLEWRHGRGGHLTLQDEDLTTKTLNGWKRLNTLAHYGVKESAVMSLVARQHDSFNINTYSKNMYPNCYYINNTQTHVLINGVLDSSGMHHHHHPQLINQQQTLTTSSHKQQYCRVYHLVKSNMDEHYFGMTTFGNKNQSHHPFLPPSNNNNCATVERTHKAIPEIYLTRLLATKGTIQKFVDDFFTTILTVNEKLPPAVKWLFDLLDDAARRHPETNDPKIIHAWKSNSLPLRFWVNFIKNPDFIFDINKTVTVDACLSVVAQTFMDACSTNEHRLGKDSPSNKLLFAKDLPHYRDMVSTFYADIARLPQISDQEMCTSMQQLSIQQNDEFDTIAALKELYIYVTTYKEQIIEALEMDINCKKLHLANKLENVGVTLDGMDDC